MWDVGQYERFREERSRPFFDLLNRIPDRSYRTIVDLGCGTGELTEVLSGHWPQSRVIGVDLSEEMLSEAGKRAEPGKLDFVQGDIGDWRSAKPVDLIVSNAALQWVPGHEALIGRVASFLAPEGVLAVQVPANCESPSHTLLQETVATGPWSEKLRGKLRHDIVLPIAGYVAAAHALGLGIDAWETVYQHVLPGKDAVLEWVKGTALRPAIKALEDPERSAFIDAYAARLRTAYPETSSGTVFAFRRLFFVARKR